MYQSPSPDHPLTLLTEMRADHSKEMVRNFLSELDTVEADHAQLLRWSASNVNQEKRLALMEVIADARKILELVKTL